MNVFLDLIISHSQVIVNSKPKIVCISAFSTFLSYKFYIFYIKSSLNPESLALRARLSAIIYPKLGADDF